MKEIYVVTGPDQARAAFGNKATAEKHLSTYGGMVVIPFVQEDVMYAAHPIPKPHVPSILILLDEMDNSPLPGRRMILFHLFSRLQKVFPDLNLAKGKWTVSVASILAPELLMEVGNG